MATAGWITSPADTSSNEQMVMRYCDSTPKSMTARAATR